MSDLETVDLRTYGPWAVVAGGSEGVGAAMARQLAEAGLSLLLLARRSGPLEQTAQECRELGVEVRTLAVDLTAADAAQQVAAAADGLEVGLLVYNAGANTHSETFLDGDLDRFAAVIALNITTPLALVQHFGRPMRDRGRGGILLVGSLAGYFGSVRHSVYGGVKAFGRIFAESLWVELLDSGVDVVELVLGVTRTPAMERVGLDFDVPGMLVAEPEDVAREGLAALRSGPVHIAGGNGPTVDKRNGPDRKRVVLGAHRAMTALMARAPHD